MRALLLAAGFGTRLRPLTDRMPKCLVPIKGESLLGIWLRILFESNIESCLINTHYLSTQVEKFVSDSIYKNKVFTIFEPELLGTAGTLIKNIDFFRGEDGLLIHSDNYCLANLDEFISAHKNRPKECLITMMTFRTKNPSQCGIVITDERGIVIEFHEKVKMPPGNLANGAIYAVSPEFLSKIKSEYVNAKDFSTEILCHFMGKIYTHEVRETLIDIGTPESYYLANNLKII